MDEDQRELMLRETVAEMFPPAILFQKEIFYLSAVWIELCKFSTILGDNLKQHLCRNVIMKLATFIYGDAKDSVAAMEMDKLVRA